MARDSAGAVGSRLAGDDPVGRGEESAYRKRFFEGVSPRVAISFLASLIGLGASIYLTVLHFEPQALVCPLGSTGGLVDCAKVVTSPQSVVFGIPVAILGLAYFVPMVVLTTPMAWRSPSRLVAPIRLGMTIVSMGFICYLIYAELYEIHSICIWCTAVHFLSFVVFVSVVTGWDEARSYAGT